MRVYLCLPSYDQRYWGNTLMSVLHCGQIPDVEKLVLPKESRQQNELAADTVSGSLLPRVFNQGLGKAVCRGYDVFVMLHADVAAEPGWLTRMLVALYRTGADVLSAVVAIKDDRDLTSTAISLPGPPYRRMLTRAECKQCATVFGADDPYLVSQGATQLLLNTGCMLMRLDRPWLKQWSGFQIRSRIDWQPEALSIDTLGEDWDMSEQLHSLGCKLMATTTVLTHHWGSRTFSSVADATVECAGPS